MKFKKTALAIILFSMSFNANAYLIWYINDQMRDMNWNQKMVREELMHQLEKEAMRELGNIKKLVITQLTNLQSMNSAATISHITDSVSYTQNNFANERYISPSNICRIIARSKEGVENGYIFKYLAQKGCDIGLTELENYFNEKYGIEENFLNNIAGGSYNENTFNTKNDKKVIQNIYDITTSINSGLSTESSVTSETRENAQIGLNLIFDHEYRSPDLKMMSNGTVSSDQLRSFISNQMFKNRFSMRLDRNSQVNNEPPENAALQHWNSVEEYSKRIEELSNDKISSDAHLRIQAIDKSYRIKTLFNLLESKTFNEAQVVVGYKIRKAS